MPCGRAVDLHQETNVTDLPKIILKPRKALPFHSRHPWVFAGTIDKIEGRPADGAEVQLLADNGKFLARGLYNSQSKIAVRLYSWDADRPLDDVFWADKIERALVLRRDLLKLNGGPDSAFRAVNSEADGLSGLTVDKFADFAVMQLTALGLGVRRAALGKLVQERLGVRGVFLRTEKSIGKLEGLDLSDGPLCGEVPPAEVVIGENGLQFAVNLSEGQKTGWYLDQRDNRIAAAAYCAGKRVLDAFCYSGGFGLQAKYAGASEVECVDASATALALVERNAALNGLDGIVRTKADAFDHLEKLVAAKRVFDVVILDPPKFARNRSAVPGAMQGYRKLHQLALKLLPAGGILVSCCCTGLITQEMLEDVLALTAAEGKRDVQILERRGPAADHPTSVSCRESSYLKSIISRVAD